MKFARGKRARSTPSTPILYLDALQVKVKDQGRVSTKAIYLAVGVNMQGLKEVLGRKHSALHKRKELCRRTASSGA